MIRAPLPSNPARGSTPSGALQVRIWSHLQESNSALSLTELHRLVGGDLDEIRAALTALVAEGLIRQMGRRWASQTPAPRTKSQSREPASDQIQQVAVEVLGRGWRWTGELVLAVTARTGESEAVVRRELERLAQKREGLQHNAMGAYEAVPEQVEGTPSSRLHSDKGDRKRARRPRCRCPSSAPDRAREGVAATGITTGDLSSLEGESGTPGAWSTPATVEAGETGEVDPGAFTTTEGPRAQVSPPPGAAPQEDADRGAPRERADKPAATAGRGARRHRGPNTLRSRGAPRRCPREDQLVELVCAHYRAQGQGLSPAAIAARTGVKDSTIRGTLRRAAQRSRVVSAWGPGGRLYYPAGAAPPASEVPHTQLLVLAVIDAHDDPSYGLVAQVADLGRGTVSNAVVRLRDKGHLAPQSPLRLTSKGRTLLEAYLTSSTSGPPGDAPIEKPTALPPPATPLRSPPSEPVGGGTPPPTLGAPASGPPPSSTTAAGATEPTPAPTSVPSPCTEKALHSMTTVPGDGAPTPQTEQVAQVPPATLEGV